MCYITFIKPEAKRETTLNKLHHLLLYITLIKPEAKRETTLNELHKLKIYYQI